MSPAHFIVLLTIFLLFFFSFLRAVGEEEEGLVKTFYRELALATGNAFQNILILLPSMPLLSSALGLPEFLVERECQWPLETKPVQISILRFQGYLHPTQRPHVLVGSTNQ